MNDETTRSDERATRSDWILTALGLVPIAGYIAAQVIVVAVWLRRIDEVGVAAKHESGEVLGAFIVAAVPAVLPALFLGLLDGIAWAGNRASFVFARILVAPALLLLCVFWILPFGRLALGNEDFYGRMVDPPSIVEHLAVLAGMELALVLELLCAILVRFIVRLANWRLRQDG